MTYFAGLDVSLRSTHICIIDEQGELVAEGKTDAEVIDIVAFLDELDVEITEVGLEAGTLTQYLTYGLRFAGYGVICMEARQVKAALSAMRNKTDKNDARGIAQILRSGIDNVSSASINGRTIRSNEPCPSLGGSLTPKILKMPRISFSRSMHLSRSAFRLVNKARTRWLSMLLM